MSGLDNTLFKHTDDPQMELLLAVREMREAKQGGLHNINKFEHITTNSLSKHRSSVLRCPSQGRALSSSKACTRSTVCNVSQTCDILLFIFCLRSEPDSVAKKPKLCGLSCVDCLQCFAPMH